MSAEVIFISQIAKIKRRVFIRTMHGIVLHASLLFLAISAIFLILTKSGLTDYHIIRPYYFLLLGISLSAGLIIGLVSRNNLLDVLIEIDRRLHLQDRLSTAYEYLQIKKKTEFSELLMIDAAAKLRKIDKKQLVPAKFTLKHLLVIILLVLDILLNTSFFSVSGPDSTYQELQKIEAAGKLLKNYTISRVENKTVQNSEPQSVYSKKMAQLSNQFNESSRTFEQRFASLDSFLKEVQGERTRLATELGVKLNSAAIKDLPIQKIPDPVKLSSSQLEKLKGILNRRLGSQLPDSIDQTIESLQELDSIEKLLSRIVDNLKDGKPNNEDSIEIGEYERRTSPSFETLENPTGGLNRTNQGGDFLDDSHKPPDRSSYPGSREFQKNGDDLSDVIGEPDGQSISAGRAKSEENDDISNYDIEQAPGTAIQDKLAASQAKSYLIRIRALTDIGEARLKEEDIYQTYRKKVESILQKEDIPINYREYIKNYFISIGLNTEKNAHEFQ